MLTPDQFEVNDAWIAVRINEQFVLVQDDPYDIFVLVDAASAYVLGFVFSKVADKAPSVKDVEDLFNQAWTIKKQWAKKLIVCNESPASNVFIQEASKNGISFEVVQLSKMSKIIGPLKKSFGQDFLGKRS